MTVLDNSLDFLSRQVLNVIYPCFGISFKTIVHHKSAVISALKMEYHHHHMTFLIFAWDCSSISTSTISDSAFTDCGLTSATYTPSLQLVASSSGGGIATPWGGGGGLCCAAFVSLFPGSLAFLPNGFRCNFFWHLVDIAHSSSAMNHKICPFIGFVVVVEYTH